MTYGHSTRLSAGNAMVERAIAKASGAFGGYQAWRQLDADRRLAAVEEALRLVSDFEDGFPVAL